MSPCCPSVTAPSPALDVVMLEQVTVEEALVGEGGEAAKTQEG